jgi:hypothetical protein
VPELAIKLLAKLGEELSISRAIVQDRSGPQFQDGFDQPWEHDQMPALQDIAKDVIVSSGWKPGLL